MNLNKISKSTSIMINRIRTLNSILIVLLSFTFTTSEVFAESAFRCTPELEENFNLFFTVKTELNNFSLDENPIRQAQFAAIKAMGIEGALWDRTRNPVRFGLFEYQGNKYSFAGYIADKNELHDSYTSMYTASVIVFFEYNTANVVGSIDADDDMSIFSCREGKIPVFENRIRL